MRCEQVTFSKASGLIEVQPPQGQGDRDFVARLSIVEDAGRLVRPVVGLDGRRVKLLGPTEQDALNAAVGYFTAQFGPLQPAIRYALGGATLGRPIVLSADAVALAS
jgi:hypothetical protein